MVECVLQLYQQLCVEIANRDQNLAADLKSKDSLDAIFGYLGLEPINVDISQPSAQPSQNLESDGEESFPESSCSPSSNESFRLRSTVNGLSLSHPPQAHNSPTNSFEGAVEPDFGLFKPTEASSLWYDGGSSEFFGPSTPSIPDGQIVQFPFSLPENGTLWNFNADAELQYPEWEVMAWDESSSTAYDSDGLFSQTLPSHQGALKLGHSFDATSLSQGVL